MPSFTGKAFANFYKNILGINQTGNTGVDTSTRTVQDGAGNNSSLSLSDDVLQVQPVNDNTTGTLIAKNSGGSNILAVDTTNSKVLVGAGQVAANTQYAQFGTDSVQSLAFSDDTHYAIPFNPESAAVLAPIGTATTSSFNDTEPATSLTISTAGQLYSSMYWYIMDDITIDAVKWLHTADAATGTDVASYLMGYTIDIANGSTSGDLSSGVKLASSGTMTNAGYEQIYYNSMTIHSANVDAGKVIMFTFAFDDTEATDYSINATIKYHLR